MKIELLNVQELNNQDLAAINGGSWLTDLAEDVGYAVGYAAGFVTGTVVVAAHIVTHELLQ
ncbi:Hypothetical protein I595_233 [Croceitalea dokdonensis DOKDO 023]|uniref:Class IIb bacteriocin, lactobin A/cerein 7B family n=1 Tax=Croceitalea dokdonensis DOKDO 023 TaxID=1300341 RepID=A0A0P7AI85_9FLAO|nr:hypothetical protein [Croceitalea dokdonensis]KPM33330.1 Hypothetical protein I595_233 [Croceitalea dokdonensis DOKDO 023]